jgi:hypothetical protein
MGVSFAYDFILLNFFTFYQSLLFLSHYFSSYLSANSNSISLLLSFSLCRLMQHA